MVWFINRRFALFLHYSMDGLSGVFLTSTLSDPPPLKYPVTYPEPKHISPSSTTPWPLPKQFVISVFNCAFDIVNCIVYFMLCILLYIIGLLFSLYYHIFCQFGLLSCLTSVTGWRE